MSNIPIKQVGKILSKNKEREERLQGMSDSYKGESAEELSLRDKRYKQLKDSYDRGEKLNTQTLIEIGMYEAENKKSQEEDI